MDKPARDQLELLPPMTDEGLRVIIHVDRKSGMIDVATAGFLLDDRPKNEPSETIVGIVSALRLQADAIIAREAEQSEISIEEYDELVRQHIAKFHDDFADPISDVTMVYREEQLDRED